MSQRFGFFATYGTPSGGALATDASDPNTTAPATGRVAQIPGRTQVHAGSLLAWADANCTAEVWAYNDDFAVWVKVASSVSVAGGAVTVLAGCALPYAKTFVRLTANGGSAKVLAWTYI